MTIGEKIKKYRQKRGFSQKFLALQCKMSEPAIRNYELGNRTPSSTHLQAISNALGVSPYAISDPQLETYDGLMHALFYLEEHYGLVAYNSDGTNALCFNTKHSSGAKVNNMISEWIRKKEELAAGKITQEYYEEWISSYPRLLTDECEKRIKEHKQKN